MDRQDSQCPASPGGQILSSMNHGDSQHSGILARQGPPSHNQCCTCSKEGHQICECPQEIFSSPSKSFSSPVLARKEDGAIGNELTEDGQYFIKNDKNLNMDVQFDSSAIEVNMDVLKSPDCDRMTQGTDQLIPCLIKEKENAFSAKQFPTGMASNVFGDFCLTCGFASPCGCDVSCPECGRLHSEEGKLSNGQDKNIGCLSDWMGSLDNKCKREILHIAYLQSDDYRMDRSLLFNCREDHERSCRRLKAGVGKIYKYFYRHEFERGNRLCIHLKRYLRDPALQLNQRCLCHLGLYCSGKPEKRKEMHCLQENFTELAPECEAALDYYIEGFVNWLQRPPIVIQ